MLPSNGRVAALEGSSRLWRPQNGCRSNRPGRWRSSACIPARRRGSGWGILAPLLPLPLYAPRREHFYFFFSVLRGSKPCSKLRSWVRASRADPAAEVSALLASAFKRSALHPPPSQTSQEFQEGVLVGDNAPSELFSSSSERNLPVLS